MSLQKAEAKSETTDQDIEIRQLKLQLIEQAEKFEKEKMAYKAAMKEGAEKIKVLLQANEQYKSVNISLNESLAETSFSDGTPKKATSSAVRDELDAVRDKYSSKALRQRKGTCPKVVEENAGIATVAAVAVAGFVAYKKFF